MNGLEAIVLTVVPVCDASSQDRRRCRGAIAQCRIVPPTALPELVDGLDIFLGDMVTIVMGFLVIPAGGVKTASSCLRSSDSIEILLRNG